MPPDQKQTVRSRFDHYVECAIWLSIAVGMWIYSFAFDRELSTFALGPVAWPRAVLVLIIVAAIGAVVADWRARRYRTQPASTDPHDVTSDAMDGVARLRLWAAILLPLLYVWLLPRAGYFATTPFFLAAYMYILGISSWRTIVLTTSVTYVLLLLLFSKLLYIPLPTGIWPGFYDFSNWLLVFLRYW